MASIKEIKQELRHREWAKQIHECQHSGQTIKEWCSSNGIKLNTYYSRLKVVREEMISRQPELHSIVLVSVSQELSENRVDLSEKAETSYNQYNTDRIIIRRNDIEIELPGKVSGQIITAMLRGLKEC